jgi:MFS family permease
MGQGVTKDHEDTVTPNAVPYGGEESGLESKDKAAIEDHLKNFAPKVGKHGFVQVLGNGCVIVEGTSKANTTGLEQLNIGSGSEKESEQHSSSPTKSSETSGPESNTPPFTEEEFTYPEGGLRAWLVVVGSWCGIFASFGIGNTLATFQAYFSEHQLASYSPSQIGWIFSIWTFLTFACGIYTGSLFDVYGPRWLVLPGSICVVLMVFLLGICTQYWHFIVVFGILGGFGSALLFTPSIAAVSHFFNRRRGNATGIAATGGAFGGIVFPLLLQSLIPKVGFAWSTRIVGFILLFLCIIANLLIRARIPKSLAHRSPHPDFRILTQPAFAMTVIGVFLLEWALFIPLAYITSYALEENYSTSFAYDILPILNAGSVFGRWLPGFVSDIIGRYNTSLVVTVVTIFCVFAIWLPFGNQTAGLVFFAVIFGLASGSNISLTPVVSIICSSTLPIKLSHPSIIDITSIFFQESKSFKQFDRLQSDIFQIV